MTQAIATFTKLGFDVALPITESAAYDIIVDTNKKLKRVQVRYTSRRLVDLRRIHSNSQGYVVKRPAENAYDWLYIYKSSGEEYLLKECRHTRTHFTPTITHLLKNSLNSLF